MSKASTSKTGMRSYFKYINPLTVFMLLFVVIIAVSMNNYGEGLGQYVFLVGILVVVGFGSLANLIINATAKSWKIALLLQMLVVAGWIVILYYLAT